MNIVAQIRTLIARYASGSTPTIDTVLAVVPATLTDNRIVNLDGKSFTFNQNGQGELLTINPTGFLTQLQATDGTAQGNLDFAADLVGNNVKFNLYAFDGTTLTKIAADAQTNSFTFSGKIISQTLLAASFANDGAAEAGGIAVGGLYHTAGAVKIRLS